MLIMHDQVLILVTKVTSKKFFFLTKFESKGFLCNKSFSVSQSDKLGGTKIVILYYAC